MPPAIRLPFPSTISKVKFPTLIVLEVISNAILTGLPSLQMSGLDIKVTSKSPFPALPGTDIVSTAIH